MTKTFSKTKVAKSCITYLISSIHFIELNFILHKSISLQNICYTMTSSIQDKFSQGHFFASSRTQSCSFPLCMMMYCTYKRRKNSFRPSLGKQYFNSNVNLAKCQQRNNVVMQATGCLCFVIACFLHSLDFQCVFATLFMIVFTAFQRINECFLTLLVRIIAALSLVLNSWSSSLSKVFNMDAIKNKMKSLKTETENALSRAQQLETECKFFKIPTYIF